MTPGPTSRSDLGGSVDQVKLAGAVMRQAVVDLRGSVPHRQRQALAFFWSEDLAFWCHRLGVSAEVVRGRLRNELSTAAAALGEPTRR